MVALFIKDFLEQWAHKSDKVLTTWLKTFLKLDQRTKPCFEFSYDFLTLKVPRNLSNRGIPECFDLTAKVFLRPRVSVWQCFDQFS